MEIKLTTITNTPSVVSHFILDRLTEGGYAELADTAKITPHYPTPVLFRERHYPGGTAELPASQ